MKNHINGLNEAEKYINQFWKDAYQNGIPEPKPWGTLYRFFVHCSDRHEFDFHPGIFKGEESWYQINTDQDASYFGNWVNPARVQDLSFVEGEIYFTQYKNRDEFYKEVFLMNHNALDDHDHGFIRKLFSH